MDDTIRKQIIGIRSKYCESILELLTSEGELYHGDLAEKLNMSPSGLNAIIKKMQECEPPIIEVMQIGKYKIYTVPSAVKEYIENKNRPKKKMDEFENEDYENALLCFQHFVEKAGTKWKDILNFLLQGAEEGVEDSVKDHFKKLMSSLVEISKYNNEEMREVMLFLGNDVLEYLIKKYIDEIEECEMILAEIGRRENGKNLLRHLTVK